MASLSRAKRCNRKECQALKLCPHRSGCKRTECEGLRRCCPHGGGYRVIFTGQDERSKTIHLGTIAKETALEIKRHVEHLLTARKTNTTRPKATTAWLTGIDPDLRAKLVKFGLADARDFGPAPSADTELAAFLDRYIAGRTDAKPRTLLNLTAARNRLVEHFGAQKRLHDITEADADGFRIAMLSQKRKDGKTPRYAMATVGRTIRRAQQFFKHAIKGKLLTENPFSEVKAPSQVNDDRKFTLPAEWSSAILDACPDAEWRLIFALCRFGGLRCPSEVLRVRWQDVDWSAGKILVHAPKTERHQGKGTRWIPIFAELRPYLDDAHEVAQDGAVYVISRYRGDNVNLRTQFTRIIERAGLDPWPRLFHSMRGTRETELMARFPVHVVCAWLGHDALIAQKHYLSVTEADFAAATADEVARQTAQAAAGDGEQPKAAATDDVENVRGNAELSAVAVRGRDETVPRVGLEPTTR